MKRLIAALILSPGIALAQVDTAEPKPTAATLSATEAILLQEVTAHRDWQARALTLNIQIADLTAKLTAAEAATRDAQAQLKAAQERSATGKAIPPAKAADASPAAN